MGRANSLTQGEVKDMILKQAIEEQRELDAREIEAFGGHLEAATEI